MFLKVIAEIDKRLPQVSVDQFMKLVQYGLEGGNRSSSTFRLIKPYNPLVMDFITQNMLNDPSTFHKLVYFYSVNNGEHDMRFVYNDFLLKLHSSVAQNLD